MKKGKLIKSSLLVLGAVGMLASCDLSNPLKKDEETQQKDDQKQEQEQKTYTKVEAKAATCTEDGNIEYYTDDDGLFYTKEGETYTEVDYSDVIVPAAHDLTHHEAVEGLLAGSDEYWECGVCHKFYQDAEGAIEINEGDWINQGYAIRWAEGEMMGTKVITPVKLNDLQGKAVTFDIKMAKDGTVSLYLNSTTANTYNVSGQIKIDKSGDNYRINKGEVSLCNKEGKEGWITITVDKAQFDGDGLGRAEPVDDPVIDCMVGPWDGKAGRSADAPMDVLVDPKSFSVVDANGIKGTHAYPNEELNTNIGTAIPLTDLEGKAISFDFKFVTDGKFAFIICASNWSNESGKITVTKTGDKVESDFGLITQKDGGYYNLAVNYSEFHGDHNIAGATDLYIFYIAPSDITAEVFIDHTHVSVIDEVEVPQRITPAGAWIEVDRVYTKEETQGKAFQFDAYFPTNDNAQIKLAFYWGIWGANEGNNQMMGDIYIRQTNGVITVTQGNAPANYQVSKKVNGWVTVAFNTDSVNYYEGTAFNIIYNWGGADTTDGCGVDNSSFKVVDALRPVRYVTGSYDIVPLTNSIAKADLVGKALQFEVYFPTDDESHIQVNLYSDTNELNCMLADVKIHQISGEYSATYGAATLVAEFSEKVNGIVTVKINYDSMILYENCIRDTASVGSHVRIWPIECGGTAGCGVFLDSFKIVDKVLVVTPVDTWGAMTPITASQLEGKAIKFAGHFATEGEAQIKVSFYDGAWVAGLFHDLFINQAADGTITATQGSKELVYEVNKLDNGWFTIKIDACTLTYQNGATAISTPYTWGGDTTAGCGIDCSTIEVADYIPVNLEFTAGTVINTGFKFAVPKADVAGKAFAFDFKMEDDGILPFTIFSSDWKNMSGQMKIVKSGDSYKLTHSAEGRAAGQVVTGPNGYMTAIINDFAFQGDGLSVGNNCQVFFGDGNVAPTTDGVIDLLSARVVDRVEQLQFCDNEWHEMPKITKEALQGKALQFKAYIPTEDDSFVKLSFCQAEWNDTFFADIFVDQKDGVLTAYQYDRVANNVIPAQFSEKVNGYVTVTINFYNIGTGAGTFAESCIVWNTTAGCGVDLASLKAVDEVADVRTYTGNPATFKKFGRTLSQSTLESEGAISFNMKMEAGKTAKVTFMEGGSDGSWKNIGTLYYKADETGAIKVYSNEGCTIERGVVTALEDGWYNIVLNNDELLGDGRTTSGDAFTNFYVERESITFDAASFTYCAAHE